MIRTWLTAAAAAGCLSSAVPQDVAPGLSADSSEACPSTDPRTERARILAIAGEVRRLVARFGETDPKAIIAPSPLRDLGLDELALADMALGLEARFGIDIAAAEPGQWQTVGDVVGFVARRVRETAPA